MNPKMPLEMYTKANRNGPIDFSMSRPRVNCNSMLKLIWIIPACKKIGTMNLHHWLGCGFPVNEPPTWGLSFGSKLHRSDSWHFIDGLLGSDVVVLGQGQLIAIAESCTPGVDRMQGTKRAPILIRTYEDGPIMGLNDGFIAIGDPVNMPGTTRLSMSRVEDTDHSKNVPFFTISAMNTATWIAVTTYTNHGIRLFTGGSLSFLFFLFPPSPPGPGN
jgi:hypothetical protein